MFIFVIVAQNLRHFSKIEDDEEQDILSIKHPGLYKIVKKLKICLH